MVYNNCRHMCHDDCRNSTCTELEHVEDGDEFSTYKCSKCKGCSITDKCNPSARDWRSATAFGPEI